MWTVSMENLAQGSNLAAHEALQGADHSILAFFLHLDGQVCASLLRRWGCIIDAFEVWRSHPTVAGHFLPRTAVRSI